MKVMTPRRLFPFWILLLSQTVFAHGLLLIDQDAQATARGDAFVATADNPSAIYYNPAGITQLAGQQLRLGGYAALYAVQYRSTANVETDSKQELIALPQFYYTFVPANVPFAFGLGLYSPFGLNMEWPENSGFRSIALEGSVEYFTLHPVIAWRVHPTFSIAAGPTLNYSEMDLKQGLSPFAGNDSFRFTGDAFAPGFTVGARWQPLEQLAFGIVYRSSTTLNYSGHTDTESITPPLSLRQNANAEFEFPQRVTFGLSWRPTTNWNAEFDADWTDWSSFGTVLIHQTTPVPPLVLDWRSSWFFSWGLTRQFAHGWHASAGYIFSENSVPDEHFNPLVPDTDRHAFSVGVGQTKERWSWNIAYQFTYGVPRTVNGSTLSPVGQSADGKYEFTAHALTAFRS